MGEIVKYNKRAQNGELPDWCGDGTAEVLDHEMGRVGFGQGGGPGVAIKVQFKTGHKLWVGQEDLDDVDDGTEK